MDRSCGTFAGYRFETVVFDTQGIFRIRRCSIPKYPLFGNGLGNEKAFPGITSFCDPSHICGKRGLLYGICAEALRLDMDGLFIESHCCPEVALSDAAQQLTPEALGKMFENLGIRQVENNKLHLGCEILIQRKG